MSKRIFVFLLAVMFLFFVCGPVRAADIKMEAGPEQLIFTSSINYFQDAPYWTFLSNGHLVGLLSGGLGPGKPSGTYFTKPGVDVLKSKLTMSDLFQARGLESGAKGAFDEQGVWLRYVYIDPAGVWHGFYHGESLWHGGNVDHQSQGYAISKDQGKNWTKPRYPNNLTITGYKGNNAADPAMRFDSQYMYMYYTEKLPNQQQGDRGEGLARATLASGGAPGSWYKYYCQPGGSCGFTEPGIGGNYTAVGMRGFNISFNTVINKYINMGQAMNLVTSADGISWQGQGRPTVIDGNGQTNAGQYSNWYPGVISLDGSSVISGQNFWFYYTKLDPNHSQQRWLYRRKITLTSGSAAPPPPPTPNEKVGDANGDGKVDASDYLLWKTGDSRADFNHDGKVDGVDYAIWFSHFNK